MPYLIGTDEAGYGPNLGPLTVTGILWRVPDLKLDLYDSLRSIVSNKPLGRRTETSESTAHLHVADSKSVYQASKTIHSLERGVLSILFALRANVPSDDRELLRDVFSKCVEDRVALLAGEHPLWSPREPFDLPLACDTGQLRTLGNRFSQTCDSADIELMDIRCSPTFPMAFNRLVESLGNKANLLSIQTMQIVSKLLASATGDNVTVFCDKHGGRSRYLPLIQQHLTQQSVTIEIESQAVSRYHWMQAGRQVTIQFSTKGESQLAVALASMISKYVREVFMHVWNEFWQQHVNDLKPTKGYPVDAKRFMRDIEVARGKLGVARSQIWRER